MTTYIKYIKNVNPGNRDDSDNKNKFVAHFLICLKRKLKNKPLDGKFKGYYGVCRYLRKKFKIPGKPTDLIPLGLKSDYPWIPDLCFESKTKDQLISDIEVLLNNS